MIPDDDRGPAALPGYQYTDFTGIEADTDAMAEFAKQLQANLAKNYEPNRDRVANAMMTPLPAAPLEFWEWYSFLTKHNAAQNVALKNAWTFGNGTTAYASAAQAIG